MEKCIVKIKPGGCGLYRRIKFPEIVIHQIKPGVVAHISKCLSDRNVNIAFMKLSGGKVSIGLLHREPPMNAALEITDWINSNPHVYHTMLIPVYKEDDHGF